MKGMMNGLVKGLVKGLVNGKGRTVAGGHMRQLGLFYG